MKLTKDDKDYLKSIGYTDDDMQQIEETSRKTTFVNDYGEKISADSAIHILGRKDFLSGIARSAFHHSALRTTGTQSVLFIRKTS